MHSPSVTEHVVVSRGCVPGVLLAICSASASAVPRTSHITLQPGKGCVDFTVSVPFAQEI